MTDRECLELLRLLHKYVTEYPESASTALSVLDVTEDLISSQDDYSPEAEQLHDEIVAVLA